MVNLTPKQRNLIMSQVLVEYIDEVKEGFQGAPAYSRRGEDSWEVYVSKDYSEDAREILKIHELAHIKLGHLNLSEYENVVNYTLRCMDRDGIDKRKVILKYGGLGSMINIAADLEVNSKYLTEENIKFMTDNGLPPVMFNSTVKGLVVNLENGTFEGYRETYYGYVEDLIRLANLDIPDVDEMIEKMKGGAKDMNLPEIPTDGNSLPTGSRVKINTDGSVEIKTPKEGDQEGEKGEGKEENPDSSAQVEEETDSFNTEYGADSSDPTFGQKVEKSPSDKLIDFIKKNITVVSDRRFVSDSMVLYNRGKCSGSEIRTGVKRIHRRIRPKKVAFLIDVSGSMSCKLIQTACSSLNELINTLNPDSEVVFWNSAERKRVKLSKFSNCSVCNSSGGTDMGKGLRRLSKEGFDVILTYSDYQTDLEPMIECVNKNRNIRFLHVIVDSDSSYSNRIRDMFGSNNTIEIDS